MEGYLHPQYAASFAEFGTPRFLTQSGGWVLERDIAGTGYRDASGCYPLLCCRDWTRLPDDLQVLKTSGLVSLTVLTDPFGNHTLDFLKRCFGRVVKFKEHYVADLSQPVETIVRPSHRATLRRALRRVMVAPVAHPADYLDYWTELFGHLARRHGIRGLRALSRDAFAAQLRVPGLVMFEARVGGQIVGLDLWYVQRDVAYGHLAAFSDLGYRWRASYATKWYALNHFSGRVRYLHLGGVAGLTDDQRLGLAAFKRGWATEVWPVYLCGLVLDLRRYDELVTARSAASAAYFPAYRSGEFE